MFNALKVAIPVIFLTLVGVSFLHSHLEKRHDATYLHPAPEIGRTYAYHPPVFSRRYGRTANGYRPTLYLTHGDFMLMASLASLRQAFPYLIFMFVAGGFVYVLAGKRILPAKPMRPD